MKSFEIENGKATLSNTPRYGWLRKEDVLYYLISTKETWENQIQYYDEEDKMHYEMKGRILALDMAISEIERA